MAKKLYDEEGNVVKGAKVKKPFYKKWWFIALVVVLVIGAFSGGDDEGASDVADDAGTADVVEDVDASEPKDENEPGEVEEEPVEETNEIANNAVNEIDTQLADIKQNVGVLPEVGNNIAVSLYFVITAIAVAIVSGSLYYKNKK